MCHLRMLSGIDWTEEEHMELYRLMGYSVGGFCEIFHEYGEDGSD